ncbi:MAG: UDP-N-acetylmuramate dehydrogenase [Flavobacteriales bacterium]
MEAFKSLRPYNTFGLDVKAKQFSTFSDIEALSMLLPSMRDLPRLVIGGGSNMLFTQDFEGLVVKNEIKGIRAVSRDAKHVTLEVGAGESWHEFVMHCVALGYGGIENLSLIPGCVGASPMQNIGAYGVEIKDTFAHLDAMEIATGTMHRFYNNDCAFGYRESIFKSVLKNQFVLCHVAFTLQLNPEVNTSYGIINQELEKMGVDSPTIKNVSQAVINIRQSKLPDPKVLGNAGSFFKNPVVPTPHVEKLKAEFPDLPTYPIDEHHVKLPAGWLIERCGWKGKTVGACGVHRMQALVLVNYGGATGKEIYNLSEAILGSVWETFQVRLEREVNIY